MVNIVLRVGLALTVFAFSFVTIINAQIQMGTVQGTISDETGAVMGDVPVTLENLLSGFRRTGPSNAAGEFSFHNVPFNFYVIRAERDGFQSFSTMLYLRSNVPLRVPIELKIMSLSEDITVMPSPELIAKDSSSAHIMVDAGALERAPGAAPSRGLSSLLTTLPGWTSDDNGLLHVRGADDEILYVLDGIPFTDRVDPQFSCPLNTEMIGSLEVITGNIPAEYGHRLGAVVAIQPKSGIDLPLFGSVQFGAGNFNNNEITVQAGGKLHDKLGFYMASSASQSHRFLDPVDWRNFNNIGAGGQLSLRLDWHPTDRDILLFHVWNGGSNFRVPNDDEQQRKQNRQRVRLRNDAQTMNWQHTWSAQTVTNLAIYHHSFTGRLLPTPRDTPFLVEQDRTHGRQGLQVHMSQQRRSHTLKVGVEGIRTTPREFFTFAVTDDDDAEELGFTRYARSFRRGNPFVYRGNRTFGQGSLYLQDSFSPYKNITLSGGLRYDYVHQIVSSQQWSPRIGGVYYIPWSKTALRASFNRLFQPPPVENHLVSSSPQARLLSPLAPSGGGYTAIRPERVSAYEVGFSQDFHGWFKLDGNLFWRRFRNFDDPNVFFATTIVFPNSVARGAAHGLDIRLDVPERHGFSGYFSYVNQNIYQIGPINGGLFLTTDLLRFGPGVKFIPDHDQRNSGSLGVTYRHRRSGAWATFSGHHESGTPLEFDEKEIPDRIRDLRRQGLQLTDVIRLASLRMRPRTILNLSTGTELLRQDRLSIGLQFDIQNLTNRLFAYNFGNPFSGTHFGYPRLYSGRLKFTFH
ncbi:MAG: TonB-dependent receptor [Acidobacteria bacterium]|nr:TonB-dependent receptor [Acidobacteriota bacterium]